MTRGALVAQRDDETIYSMVARLARYLAIDDAGRLHRSLFGRDLPILDGMAANLEAVMKTGVLGLVDGRHAMTEATTYRYHARYVHPARRAAAEKAMMEGGVVPSSKLGMSPNLLDERTLRYCRSCLEDMLELHGDTWWRRTHQLPSTLVCPDHGELLRVSLVGSAVRKTRYVAASPTSCPIDAQETCDDASSVVRADLLKLARSADLLLDAEDVLHPDDVREDYLKRLGGAGMINRAGEADIAKVARAMDRYWGATLQCWDGLLTDGRCSQAWLGRLLLGDHRSPTHHHLLLKGLLKALDAQ